MAVSSERCTKDANRQSIRVGILVVLAALSTAGCTRANASAMEPAPTYIPQPTPDPTMAVVIQGGGLPVSYLPPLEMKGSPTPVPAAARPGAPTGPRPAAKPALTTPAAATRETVPAREPAPAPKPTAARESAPAPAPASKPAPAAAPTARPAPANSGSGPATGGQPAIINPNTALPGAARPNPTPAR